MVIELSVVQFGLNHTSDFKIERVRVQFEITSMHDFRPTLYDTNFNYNL